MAATRPTPRPFFRPGTVRLHSDWEPEVVGEVYKFLKTRVEPEAQAIAKAKAPVDTGELKSKTFAKVTRVGKVVVSLEVGSRAAHADFVEYGTGRRGAKTWTVRSGKLGKPDSYVHGGKPGMVAQPFLRPTLIDVARRFFKYGG